MRLESARDLKAELVRTVLGGLPMGRRAALDFGVPAGRLSSVDAVQPTLALGIAPAPGDRSRIAVRVQRSALMDGEIVRRIGEAASGEVDVRYIGPVRAQVTPRFMRGRHRPVLIGSSIAHVSVTAGSITAVVELIGSGDRRLLSCNHVLADENRARRGDAVVQPGPLDGGRTPRDLVGTLGRFVPLDRTGVNTVDCALAIPRDGVQLDRLKLTGSGRLMGVKQAPVAVGEVMSKLGRTTGLTDGRVTAVEIDNLVISYETGNYRFNDQMELEGAGPDPFSRPGDSGALVYTKTGRRAVAMVFAGSSQGGSNGRGLSFATPIRRVFHELGVRLDV